MFCICFFAFCQKVSVIPAFKKKLVLVCLNLFFVFVFLNEHDDEREK